MVNWTSACIKNVVSCSFAFLQELEDMSSPESFPTLKGGFYEAAGEEVNCFLGIDTVADVESLDGNHSEDGRE